MTNNKIFLIMCAKTKNFKKESGFTLIEIVITLGILTALMLMAVGFNAQSLKKISVNLYSKEIFQMVNLARTSAKAYDSDTQVKLSEDSLLIETPAQTIFSIPRNKAINSALNSKMGFKSSGYTKFAGTVSIGSFGNLKQVSLGVGYGRVSLK